MIHSRKRNTQNHDIDETKAEHFYSESWQMLAKCQKSNLVGGPCEDKKHKLKQKKTSTSRKKVVSNCGDSKSKWNGLNEEQSTEMPKIMSNTPTSIDSNDIFKHSFFNTFLNPADKTVYKKKLNKKSAKHWKKRPVNHDLSKENLDEDVDGLLSSALGRRLEVADEQDDEDDYADVMSSKKKKRKRSQLTKKKGKCLNISPHRKNKESAKLNSHIEHSHPNKLISMKKNKKYARKISPEPKDKEICEANFITLVNVFNDEKRNESSTIMTKSSSYICENDISSQESSYMEKLDKALTLDNSINKKGEINSEQDSIHDIEQDIIQDIEHRVLDRLLISALGNINKDCEFKDNEQYNEQCVNKDKIKEQVTYFLANKLNEDHLIEIPKPISKRPSSIYSNEIPAKDRKQLVSFSDTKVEKPKTKIKRKKNNAPKKRKINFSSDYEIVIGSHNMEASELHEGVVDHISDEYNVDNYKVYDANVDSHNVYDHSRSDTTEITNLLLSNLSPFVESISYPKFIYDTNDSDTTIIDHGVKEAEKLTQNCHSITDERQVESVRAIEQVFIDQTGDSSDFQYHQAIAHSKTNQYLIEEKTFSELDPLNQPSYCDVIPEEDEINLGTKTESEFESHVLNQPNYKELRDVISEEESTLTPETVSDLYYDVMDDSDKENRKTKIDNLVEGAVVTQQPRDLLKKTIDQSINVTRCKCHNSIIIPLPSILFVVTIFIINIVIFLKNTGVLWIGLVSLLQFIKRNIC